MANARRCNAPMESLRIPLPNKKVLDLCRFREQGDEYPLPSFDFARQLCGEFKSAFMQEAVIQEFIDANPQEPHIDEWSAIDLGIHPRHPLFELREDVRERVENQGWAYEGEAAFLWGPLARSGAGLYREAGLLLRTPGLRQRLEVFPNLTMLNVVEEWAQAGATKLKSREALRRMAEDVLLSEPPHYMSVPIDMEAFKLVLAATRHDPRLAVPFCRCLMRIAAMSVGGRVRWWATWLRGEGTNEDAIPGASTYSKELKRLLDEHVFAAKVRNHRSGQRAATYSLKKPIRQGPYDHTHVEQFVRPLSQQR